jgi:hypothetical protein
LSISESVRSIADGNNDHCLLEIEKIALLPILPQGWKTISIYFQEHILRELAVQKYTRGRKPSTTRYILHFDNAPVHNTEEGEQILQEREFLGLKLPPYSPDLSSCGIFLCGYPYEKTKRLSYERIDELEEATTKTIEGIPKGTLIGVFHASKRRLKQCIQKERNYFE